MKKRVFIVHGWDYNPEMNWYPWIKNELENKGFEVKVLDMPNTSEPKIEEWVLKIKKEVQKPDQNTYFIGHSIGCQAIMRYLETIENKVGGCLFVAAWFKLNNLEGEEVEKIANPWTNTKLNFDKIKKNSNKLTVFISNNDPYNCVEENENIFKKNLKAKVIIQSQAGHFTSDDGFDEIPNLIKEFMVLIR